MNCRATTRALRVCAVVGLLVGVPLSSVPAQEMRIISHYDNHVLLAVDDSGDWYSQNMNSVEWNYRGNVFESAGVEPMAELVAFENQDWNGNRPTIIDALGNEFLMNTTNSTWSVIGNIADESGHPATGTFIDMTEYQGTIVAITNGGDWYERTVSGEWVFRANIFEAAGVVPNEKIGWSGVKGRFKNINE